MLTAARAGAPSDTLSDFGLKVRQARHHTRGILDNPAPPTAGKVSDSNSMSREHWHELEQRMLTAITGRDRRERAKMKDYLVVHHRTSCYTRTSTHIDTRACTQAYLSPAAVVRVPAEVQSGRRVNYVRWINSIQASEQVNNIRG